MLTRRLGSRHAQACQRLGSRCAGKGSEGTQARPPSPVGLGGALSPAWAGWPAAAAAAYGTAVPGARGWLAPRVRHKSLSESGNGHAATLPTVLASRTKYTQQGLFRPTSPKR